MTMRKMTLSNWPTIVRVTWRHRYRFAAPALGVFAVVWVGSLFVPRSYEASARFRRSSDALLTRTTDDAVAPMRRTIEQDVKARAVLETVASEFDRSVESLEKRVSVDAEVSSGAVDVVEVAVRDRDPKRAAEIANRLVEVYLVTARESLVQAEAFFTKQIESRQDELAMLRLDKGHLEQENPTLVDSAADASRDALIATRAELRAIEQQLAQIAQEHDTLAAFVDAQPDHLEQRTRGRNPEVANLNNQKAQLEQELNEHRYKWGRTDDHPLVQKTLAKIASIDAKIAQTPGIIDLAAQRQDNPAKLEAKAKLESLAAVQRSLTARRDTLAQEVEELGNERQVNFLGRDEHAELVRKIAAAQQDLDFWQNKRRDVTLAQTAGVAGTSAAGGLTFLDRAAPPGRPAFPAPGMPTLLALLAGLLAGTGTVIATRVTDRSFDSAEDAQRELDLPVLGIVAEMTEPPAAATTWRRAA